MRQDEVVLCLFRGAEDDVRRVVGGRPDPVRPPSQGGVLAMAHRHQ
jgi:hypothetical protein